MVTVLAPHLISLLCIAIIIVSLLIGYLKKRILITYIIIIVNFIIFFLSLLFSTEIIGDLAFRPVYLSLELFPQLYTLFTSMFLHSVSDLFHIIFNTLMFILVAPHFENRVGRKKFLAIYIITGVCAALFHALIAPLLSSDVNPMIGLIGASGAISGVIGAYAYAYPRDTVFFPVGFFIMKIPVLIAGALFIAIQSVYVFIGGDPSVAYLAHVGGFIAGLIIAAVLIRKREKEEYNASGTPVYPDSSYKEIKRINFSNLSALATTNDLKEMVHRIQNETVPQVRDIWLEHFLEKIACPVCRKPLNHFNRKIWCEENHFRTEY